ncbi:MAG TPA: hypothetical protein VKK61_08930 [Tepidisphaeraceae bacterium]|nr:hypothetical protein [Tepidisphaeraceae bacterium]
MTKKELEERLNAEPFEPFRINVADGKHFDVRNPRLVVPMETRLFIAYGKEEWTFIVLRHITSLESVQAA